MTPKARMAKKTPDRGDIYQIRLNPTEGHEMQGHFRPVLVLSPAAFNQHNPPICAPITQGGNFSRVQGFAVTLLGAGTRTQGAIIVSQVRTLDFTQRGAEYLEAVPDAIIQDALLRLQAILDF